MVALQTPQAELGWQAADFNLEGVDINMYRLNDVAGSNGLLVMFICNHCPYVQRQLDTMVDVAHRLKEVGVGVVAINSNDTDAYPEDSFENMKQLAHDYAFPFPYLLDETQEVAKAYGAVCTPDFFGFNAALKLQYRGRIDRDGDDKSELLLAMQQIAEMGRTNLPQEPSVGCSIKWRVAV
ncbi:MAG: thioredoxin family protein [Rickettsiales bacterium]|nr:thioredoxin family protein [Rickettsiales bacterium]